MHFTLCVSFEEKSFRNNILNIYPDILKTHT